ncbi:MAG: M28 family peptidase, partial [Saprospiraceae bacterium]|nr:M28 family peptidase [Saprospiraceae bacterium]
MKNALLFALLFAAGNNLFAQTNILITNPEAETVLKGTYDPAQYAASLVIENPVLVAAGLQERISPDSLKAYIIRQSTFGTRNTGADTVSDVTGMGASRRWVFEKFKTFGAENEDRLLPFYLQFNQDICGMGQHRNICAVLPGANPARHGVIIIEGHIDSRCDVLCDVNCAAEGVEDNATGTALVMELARVMSTYTFNQTIVFMVTIGEEQGLLGADAFAT